ncbi:hypothetical protein E2562_016390 [Oryza meyeriana var. granulata]|uniref:Uncharacterized protein n=1 Tax=Oryza meyeriana var. granulata TaxID=110450 RepID=A0A6G1EX18_9ORYZ|nr:hypothetical protein E2562_016390 [Oryza meyeriana var. granulata]
MATSGKEVAVNSSGRCGGRGRVQDTLQVMRPPYQEMILSLFAIVWTIRHFVMMRQAFDLMSVCTA